jgi:hypothetical protein
MHTLKVWETWTVAAADGVHCDHVSWQINFLLTFETTPFFCVYPVFIIILLNRNSEHYILYIYHITFNYSQWKIKIPKLLAFFILKFTLGFTQMSDHVVDTLTQFTVYFLQLALAHFIVMSSGVPDKKS